jgi:4-hydroxybenzoate polyprenyltransferase
VQWTKNAVVLAPLIFAQKASDPELLILGLLATLLFCLISGSNYIVNDLMDRNQDRNHPVKSSRPIIRGSLRPAAALTAFLIIAAASLALSFAINTRFGWIALSYMLLGIVYSLFLKKIVIIDVMTIAGLFVLRVAGGAAAVQVGVSHWLFLCTILLALFLGFGKRRHELVLLDDKAGEHREILKEYSPYFLDQMMSVVTASTVITYSFYTISPEVVEKLGTPRLYLTIPFVLYGIFRYLYLIHQKEEGGSPSSILVSDKPLLINVLLWIITVMGMLYTGS